MPIGRLRASPISLRELQEEELKELRQRQELLKQKNEAVEVKKIEEQIQAQIRLQTQQLMVWLKDNLPQLHPFSRQEQEFLEAESHVDRNRKQVGMCLKTLRERAEPVRLELELIPPSAVATAGARSIVPNRSHKKLRQGEDIIFRLESPVNGYLSVFNLGTTGSALLIYPNAWQKVGKIRARTPHIVPDNAEYCYGKLEMISNCFGGAE
jgi:hypothetical protein